MDLESHSGHKSHVVLFHAAGPMVCLPMLSINLFEHLYGGVYQPLSLLVPSFTQKIRPDRSLDVYCQG